jgi:Type IV pilin-like G and H, putative
MLLNRSIYQYLLTISRMNRPSSWQSRVVFAALGLPVFLIAAAQAQLPNSRAKSPGEMIKSLESQARQYVTSMNRAQQAYYAENVGFTSSVANLGMGIKPQTDNYTYSISAGNKAVFNYGISRKPNLKSFVGGVFLTANKTQTILCEASVAGRARPANPTNKNGVLACGANTAVPKLANQPIQANPAEAKQYLK